MKNYDFKKAVAIIKENEPNIIEACLGMHEDWFWTAETIWTKEDGFKKEFPENPEIIYAQYIKARNEGVSLLDERLREYDSVMIAGINGSSWATPAIELIFSDGSDKMLPCYTDDGETVNKPADVPWLGSLSGPVQENITPLSD